MGVKFCISHQGKHRLEVFENMVLKKIFIGERN